LKILALSILFRGGKYMKLFLTSSVGGNYIEDGVRLPCALDGEVIDPSYQRYLDGLGLTQISILPHYQYLKDISIDGLRIVEDISLPDSRVRPFYALVDGAYIFIDMDEATLYGEAYYFCDGVITKVCDTDKCIQL
jgi:dipeptidase E